MMKRILTLALVATMTACGSGGGTTDGGGKLPDGGAGGGSAGGGAGGGSGGGAAGGGAGGGAAGGGAGGGVGGGAAGGGAGGGVGGGAAGGGAGGGVGGGAAGGGAGGGVGGGAGGGVGGGAGGAGGGVGGGAGGGAGATCALNNPAACVNNTFCYVTSTSGSMGQCLGGPCDVVTQNCTAANTQCTYGPDGGRDCFPDGTLNEGDLCGAGISMACKKTTTCVNGIGLGDGGMGSACAKYCRTSTDCLGGKVCNIGVQIPGSNERPLICNFPPAMCSILAQDCANTANGCYPASATTSGCFPAGTTATGATCASGNACMKGSLCINQQDGGNGCRPVCNADGGTPACPGGTGACNPLTFGQGVGACL